MLTRLTARHLRQPSGLVGRYFGRAMNRINEQMNATAIDRLQVAPRHRVLDIGFGGGLSLGLLAGRVTEGQVHGVEISETMLSRARREFRAELDAGRVVLTRADIGALPFEDASFDRACTVNTLYFWPDPAQALREIHRVLVPQGRLALCYRPREVMQRLPFTRHDFELYTIAQVQSLLAAHGFRSHGHTQHKDAHLGFACVAATREQN